VAPEVSAPDERIVLASYFAASVRDVLESTVRRCIAHQYDAVTAR
jgi:hypothetical protein